MDLLLAAEIEPPAAAREVVRQQRGIELRIRNTETEPLIEARLRHMQPGFPIVPSARSRHLSAYSEIRQRALLRDRRRKIVERVPARIIVDGVIAVEDVYARERLGVE